MVITQCAFFQIEFMASKLAPIGFEKIYSNEMKVYIGFEQFEDERRNSPTRVYPLGKF